jgi:hypothetical protein
VLLVKLRVMYCNGRSHQDSYDKDGDGC